jgi:hypothetical protein
MTRRAGMVTCGLMLTLAVPARGLAGAAPGPRVRPMSRIATSTVATATKRSATIRDLVARLERSDLIVLVDFERDPTLRQGRTNFLSASDFGRYVKIQVNLILDPDRRFEVLGHELQHANEIADAPEVRDEEGLRAYMRRIGVAMGGRDEYETRAAQSVEVSVRRDLHRKSTGSGPRAAMMQHASDELLRLDSLPGRRDTFRLVLTACRWPLATFVSGSRFRDGSMGHKLPAAVLGSIHPYEPD